MTYKQLVNTMDAAEFREWLAFETLNNKDYREQLEKSIIYDSIETTPEDESAAIRNIFGAMSN